jgi:hypothetical protein
MSYIKDKQKVKDIILFNRMEVKKEKGNKKVKREKN